MNKFKSIKIDEDTFKELKKFCNLHGYKMYKFASDAIHGRIEKQEILNVLDKKLLTKKK
jgi:hypothetical protein